MKSLSQIKEKVLQLKDENEERIHDYCSNGGGRFLRDYPLIQNHLDNNAAFDGCMYPNSTNSCMN